VAASQSSQIKPAQFKVRTSIGLVRKRSRQMASRISGQISFTERTPTLLNNGKVLVQGGDDVDPSDFRRWFDSNARPGRTSALQRIVHRHLSDSRRGKNIQLPPADLLRQPIYRRLAGYADVNDAGRLLRIRLSG